MDKLVVGVIVALIIAVVILIFFLIKDKDKDQVKPPSEPRLIMKSDGTMLLKFAEPFIGISKACLVCNSINYYVDEDVEQTSSELADSVYEHRAQMLELADSVSEGTIYMEENLEDMKALAGKLISVSADVDFVSNFRKIDVGGNIDVNDEGTIVYKTGMIVFDSLKSGGNFYEKKNANNDIKMGINLTDCVSSELLDKTKNVIWAGLSQNTSCVEGIVKTLLYMKENNIKISEDTLEWETYPQSRLNFEDLKIKQMSEGFVLFEDAMDMIQYAILNNSAKLLENIHGTEPISIVDPEFNGYMGSIMLFDRNGGWTKIEKSGVLTNFPDVYKEKLYKDAPLKSLFSGFTTEYALTNLEELTETLNEEGDMVPSDHLIKHITSFLAANEGYDDTDPSSTQINDYLEGLVDIQLELGEGGLVSYE